MSKTVTIPNDGMNPFVVMHNGEKYVYAPGETVDVPDGVALEIEEYNRVKHPGEVVPPFAGGGVQPDWNQNYPNAPDYVKNRTHYVEKAFEDIEWDGDTTGLVSAITAQTAFQFYKVSDQVPTIEDLLGATLERFDGELIEIDEQEFYQLNEDVLYCHQPHVIITYAPNAKAWDDVFPSAGVYFMAAPSNGMYTHSLKAKETVHKLDEKFLPSGGGMMITNVLWYGDDPKLDKTYAEVHDALVAGKNVILIDEMMVFNLCWWGNDTVCFSHIDVQSSFAEIVSFELSNDDILICNSRVFSI